MKIKRSRQDIVIDVLIGVVMAAVVFATLYPFYLAMVLSLNEGLDAQSGGIYFWPRRFTLENYTSLFKDDSWLRAFFVQDKSLRTMAYLMMAVINQSSSKNLSGVSAQMAASSSSTTTLSIQLAAMMISVLPILCVYPFFQRYFVTGLTVGAVKS